MPVSVDEIRAALGDRYEVERELGRGGFATVFLARDPRHARRVAIKVLEPGLAHGDGAERFLREITFAATLSHPNILPLFDSGTADGLLFYVMPYAEGESLRARLLREGALPIDDALRIACGVLDGLAYAHERNILHRDIKPENILLESGHAVIADFGIARALEATGSEAITASGLLIGTPAYMSPEQAVGDTRLDGRSDLYAVGCVLYEMLGGEPPVTGPSPQAILARRLAGEVRPLRPIRRTVSPALDATLQRALAPNPADRFATAGAFKAELDAHRSGAYAAALLAGVRPAWRRVPASLRNVGLALLTVLVLAGGVYGGQRYLAGVRRADAARGIAVLPFLIHNGGEDLAEGLADLLATTLEGTPGLRIVDPWALWRPLRAKRGGPASSPDPTEANEISRRFGARYFILGSLAEAARVFTLTLRIYRVGNAERYETLKVEAPADSIGSLVQRAAVSVITHITNGDSTAAGAAMDQMVTASPEALKAYLEARAAMRRGLLDEADASITRALKLDTAFAIAAIEAVTIRSWISFARAQPYGDPAELVALAVRHSQGLSERQRLRVQMHEASVRGQGARTAELGERLVQLDPADIDTWVMLAYSHLTMGWQYGAGPAEARSAIDRAFELDSTHVPALAHRAYLSAWSADPSDMRQQIALLHAADTSQSIVRGSELALSALLVDDASYSALLDTIVEQPVERWLAVLRMVRAYRPERAELLLDRMLARPGSGFPRRAATGARAQLMLGEGRVGEIGRQFRDGAFAEFPSFERTIAGAIISTSIAGIEDTTLTPVALSEISKWVTPDSAAAQFATRPVLWFGWAQAAHHAMRGDTVRARRWQRAFATLPAIPNLPTYREALTADIDARLAARSGDLTGARRHAWNAFRLWTDHDSNELEYNPAPAIRLHLAQLLQAANLPDSAASMFRSLMPPGTWMGSLGTRAELEMGRLAEDRGDRGEAAVYYGLALRMWERGGPDVERWRAEAAAGLARTGGERARVRIPMTP
jgi:serine/threonine-protein kinase